MRFALWSLLSVITRITSVTQELSVVRTPNLRDMRAWDSTAALRLAGRLAVRALPR